MRWAKKSASQRLPRLFLCLLPGAVLLSHWAVSDLQWSFAGLCQARQLHSHRCQAREKAVTRGGGGVAVVEHKVAPPPTDAIFQWLDEAYPGNWGEVLDAGTGPDSLRWLAHRQFSAVTAVTAESGMYATVEDEVGPYLDPSSDELLVGSWAARGFLEGSSFDVVVADYLLGALDTTAPHFQEWVMYRLWQVTKPGGLLILIGKEPTPQTPDKGVPHLYRAVEALRDSAIVVSGQRLYRELPQWWIRQHMLDLGFEIQEEKVFRKMVNHEKMDAQLEWAQDAIAEVTDKPIKNAMRGKLGALRRACHSEPSLEEGVLFGQDYLFVARRPA
mmetsp:Transcript_17752/g.41319  ORF Transcript_17752/g.41319 Transcript_17752/m.41319 type:complete len:330 (-) Transcript_17752:63-1052(-)